MTLPAEKYDKLNDIIEMVNMSEISSIKNVVTSIIQIINDPKSNAKNLRDIIQVDPPLTAKLLKLANSAYYSSRVKVVEIQQAIIWVGYDAVKQLALSQKVCEIFKKDADLVDYSRAALWRHSVAVALLGKMIYRREFGDKGENIYAAGLLHDLGLIIEDQFFQDTFKRALLLSKKGGKNLPKIEEAIFGFDHMEVGGAITEDWKIPNEIVVAISNHHTPDLAERADYRMALTLYVADHLCQEKGIGYGDATYEGDTFFNKCIKKLNLERHALDLIIEDVEQEIITMEKQGFFES